MPLTRAAGTAPFKNCRRAPLLLRRLDLLEEIGTDQIGEVLVHRVDRLLEVGTVRPRTILTPFFSISAMASALALPALTNIVSPGLLGGWQGRSPACFGDSDSSFFLLIMKTVAVQMWSETARLLATS